MWFTKYDYLLILIVFPSYFVYAGTEESANKTWWENARSHIWNIIPGYWSSPENESKELENTAIQNDDEKLDTHKISVTSNAEKNEELENDEELKPKAVPFSTFAQNLNSMVSSGVDLSAETVKNIYKSIRNAILNNKLETNVVVGSKNILVSLGILGSDERTKNLNEVTSFLQNIINWIMEKLKSIFGHNVDSNSKVSVSTASPDTYNQLDKNDVQVINAFFSGIDKVKDELKEKGLYNDELDKEISTFKTKYREMQRNWKSMNGKPDEVEQNLRTNRELMHSTFLAMNDILNNKVIMDHIPDSLEKI